MNFKLFFEGTGQGYSTGKSALVIYSLPVKFISACPGSIESVSVAKMTRSLAPWLDIYVTLHVDPCSSLTKLNRELIKHS